MWLHWWLTASRRRGQRFWRQKTQQLERRALQCCVQRSGQIPTTIKRPSLLYDLDIFEAGHLLGAAKKLAGISVKVYD